MDSASLLMGFAQEYVEKYNLDPSMVNKQAKELLAGVEGINLDDATRPDNIILSLIDLNSPIADEVFSETLLSSFSDEGINLITCLVETRRFHTLIRPHLNITWCWSNVFGLPRGQQVHPIILQANDHVTKFEDEDGEAAPWVREAASAINNSSPMLNWLRNTYFSGGVDEAAASFTNIYSRDLKGAITQLLNRCEFIKSKGLDRTALYLSARELAEEAKEALSTMEKRCKAWEKETKVQLALARLPGATHNFHYGHDATVDFELDSLSTRDLNVFSSSAASTTHHGSMYTNVRWKPGTVWSDWFVNLNQPRYALSRYRSVCGGVAANEPNQAEQAEQAKKIEKAEKAEKPKPKQPYEIRVPMEVFRLLAYFNDFYNEYQHDEHFPLHGKKKSEAEAEATAKELSDATKEPYWRLRDDTEKMSTTVDMSLLNEAKFIFPTRDGAANACFDYMSRVLGHMITGSLSPVPMEQLLLVLAAE